MEHATRTELDTLLLQRALTVKTSRMNDNMIDLIADGKLKFEGELPLKNLCARCSVELADSVDAVCGLLDITKRRFIEAAIIEAVNKANAVIAEEGLADYFASTSSMIVEVETKEGGE